ncbi:MAG: tryptophan synthase subunit alpha [Coriobacteriales bacterium]|jgi:tryptophan synthase alpha chain|nr:tryptophan synthase subunit alpha [Coriobacteriales bacterium]
MSRIDVAFSRCRAAGNTAFIGFVTGGDPSLAHSKRYIQAMADAGADVLEIGVPFSDPIAEGPVIQDANIRALAANTTLDGIFGLVGELRQEGYSPLPLVLLTYLNPVFHYGYERFFSRSAEAGVDGVIIPDLPFEERDELLPAARAAGVDVISMIAPTSTERTERIAREATGFIYLVSSLGVTGVRSQINTDLDAIIQRIRAVSDVPVAVGFGLHSPEQARQIGPLADGFIVGSAIVKMIAADPQAAEQQLHKYVKEMKAALGALDAAGGTTRAPNM